MGKTNTQSQYKIHYTHNMSLSINHSNARKEFWSNSLGTLLSDAIPGYWIGHINKLRACLG